MQRLISIAGFYLLLPFIYNLPRICISSFKAAGIPLWNRVSK